MRERNSATVVRLLPRQHALASGHPVKVCFRARNRDRQSAIQITRSRARARPSSSSAPPRTRAKYFAARVSATFTTPRARTRARDARIRARVARPQPRVVASRHVLSTTSGARLTAAAPRIIVRFNPSLFPVTNEFVGRARDVVEDANIVRAV